LDDRRNSDSFNISNESNGIYQPKRSVSNILQSPSMAKRSLSQLHSIMNHNDNNKVRAL